MALPDGVNWTEAIPDDNTVANQIDDYMRDMLMAVRSRMAREHIWSNSQTATSEAGFHNYISLQQQTAAPTLVAASNQVGAVYIGSSASGYPLMFENSAGTAITVVNSAGKVSAITGGTQGSIVICSSANPTSLLALTASTDTFVLVTKSATAAPVWLAASSLVHQAPSTAVITTHNPGVEQTNTSTRAILVFVQWAAGGQSGSVLARRGAASPTTTAAYWSQSDYGAANIKSPGSFMVPPTWHWDVATSGNGSVGVIESWEV